MVIVIRVPIDLVPFKTAELAASILWARLFVQKAFKLQSLSNLDNDFLEGLFDRHRDNILDFLWRTSKQACQYGTSLKIKLYRSVLNVGRAYSLLLPQQTEKKVPLHRRSYQLRLDISELGLQIGNRIGVAMVCDRGADIFLHVACSSGQLEHRDRSHSYCTHWRSQTKAMRDCDRADRSLSSGSADR